jgi:hypothetical protein
MPNSNIPIDSQLVRRNDADFVLVDDTNLGGSLRVVPDLVARANIPSSMLKVGMVVFVQSDSTYFTLTVVSPPTYIPLVFPGGLPPFSGTDGAVVVEEGNPTPFAEFRQLTEDDIQPAFADSLFSTLVQVQELGASISGPQFTATYVGVPIVATLADGVDSQFIPSPFLSFGYGPPGTFPARSYSKSTINATVTWVLNANAANSPNRASAITAVWEARRFFGSAVPAAFTEAFIEALTGSGLAPNELGVFPFAAPTAGKKLYIAYPTAFGTPASIKDQNGITFPMVVAATAVPVTNAFSVLVPGGYTVLESFNFITQPFTLTVT